MFKQSAIRLSGMAIAQLASVICVEMLKFYYYYAVYYYPQEWQLYSGNPAMLFAYTVWQRSLPYCIYSGNEWHYAWYFFFFTRCVFSDIIRLNNLIFQVICRFRHLNSNIISFAMIFFTLNFTKISDDIFGI